MDYFADKKKIIRFIEEKKNKKKKCLIYNEIYRRIFGATNCCPLSFLTSFGGLFSVD